MCSGGRWGECRGVCESRFQRSCLLLFMESWERCPRFATANPSCGGLGIDRAFGCYQL